MTLMRLTAMTDTADQVRQELLTAERVLVISHVRPDGDAVGSLLGLGLSLLEAGKEVQMVLADGVPQALRFLPGNEKILYQPSGAADLTVVLDCSDFERVGSVVKHLGQPDINIDHHITNEHFARINLVDATATATSEMLAYYLPRWGLPVTTECADALLTGILMDTIGFRTANVKPKTLRLVADLMDAGSKLAHLYKKALLQKSMNAVKLWGSGLSKLQREGSIIWTTLSLEDRARAEYVGRDDADLINLLSFLNGADVAIVFNEQPEGKVKVSWRAQSDDKDVSQIAVRFGGGGHRAAAGAEITGELTEVQSLVLDATRTLFEREA